MTKKKSTTKKPNIAKKTKKAKKAAVKTPQTQDEKFDLELNEPVKGGYLEINPEGSEQLIKLGPGRLVKTLRIRQTGPGKITVVTLQGIRHVVAIEPKHKFTDFINRNNSWQIIDRENNPN